MSLTFDEKKTIIFKEGGGGFLKKEYTPGEVTFNLKRIYPIHKGIL